MPAKTKSAKSARKSAKMRDMKPSKDAKGGTGPGIKPGFIGNNRRQRLN